MKRKICVITGSRAEYGLLKPLLDEIKRDSNIELQIVATGMHLSAEFGLTYREIKTDGFIIDKKVNIHLNSDTPLGISRSMGAALAGFARVFTQLKPDLAVVLGDRFEIFSAVSAACVNRIPVAHIHGGEITKGAFDNAFRHAITKMSQLHFVALDEYRRRVIQLGECPDTVFNVGALGLDNIKNLKLLTKQRLEEDLDFRFNIRNLLVTFHPVTLENNTAQRQMRNLLAALDGLRDTNMIFTKTNADTDGRIINRLIERYAARNPRKAAVFTSLGRLKYLSAMQFIDAVVGNSSSGIIEAPSLKVGTINIGDRQSGRVKAKSIIDCPPSKKGIEGAIKKLYSKGFIKSLKDVHNPYGDGNAAKRIKRIIANHSLKDILKKDFYDI
ncbi:MAG: UDP-N-acetylglucosamine 2-epimerase [Candidatus Omnitrophota bacterium]